MHNAATAPQLRALPHRWLMLPLRVNRPIRFLLGLATAGFLVVLRLEAQTDPALRPHTSWIGAGSPQTLPREMIFENALGRFGVLNVSGPMPRVEVAGFRAATRLSNGQVMTERDGMGAIRARKVADTLAGLGVPARAIAVNASTEAQSADGVNDPWNRRVEIRVR